MTGNAVALRSAIPLSLSQHGVRMLDQDGVRGIYLPDDLREKCNVLTPRSEITQADPMWAPALRLVKLDRDKHTYPGQKPGERALSKLGIEELAELAGVEIVSTWRVPAADPDVIEWKAKVRVRTSDGTYRSVVKGRVMERSVEARAIEHQVRSSDRNRGKTEAQLQAMIEARVAKESPHWHAKCETFATLRAIRSLMRLPPSYTDAELQRPFLVVGVNFAPDYSDAETRRMLVEAGLNAQSALYGGGPVGELGAAPAEVEIPLDVQDDEDDTHDGYQPVEGEVVGGHVVTGQDPWDADPPAPPAAAAPQPDPAARVAEAAGATVLPYKKHKGKTIAQVAADDADYLTYLLGLSPRSENDRTIQEHIRDFLNTRSGQASLS